VVRRVAAFCRAKGVKATIVFDGHPLRPDMAAQDLGGVTLRVPPQGEDADSVIRALIERAENPAQWVVVTSDKALYSYVRTLGAAVLRAHEWNEAERQARASAASAAEKPDHEDDIEGWLRRFGGGGQ
jgi:predicted RNA-binding protein with PIN domain